jgi:NAD(P)-dependent dehydrogenase (short-subunit alcohol dehydrogenase family)/rhamnose utilization protein RhaD (predicted bifunctional aldolase and dehydrogenase)
MNKYLSDLIEISRFYGSNKDFIIAGGGNTSYKNERHIWVKGSGSSLADITLDGFAVLDRKQLEPMINKKYSEDLNMREAEVKADLAAACMPDAGVRPSVETSLHNLIRYSYVVHTHPTLINALTCANDAEAKIRELFGEDILFVPYCNPGYLLFAKTANLLESWRMKHKSDPQVVFIQNHGIVVSADSIEKIRKTYDNITNTISKQIKQHLDIRQAEIPRNIVKILPALRIMFSEEGIKTVRIRNNILIQHFIKNAESFKQVMPPFTPDQVVYCKAKSLFLKEEKPESIISECSRKLTEFKKQHGYLPKVAGLKGYGIIAFEDNLKSVEYVHDVFEDKMKISFLSHNFGGPHFLEKSSIDFIDNWEVENYRRKAIRTSQKQGRAENKTVIVTGGAQGFGSGIAADFFAEGANVIIADILENKGSETTEKLNSECQKNKALFVKTDVTSPDSLENLIYETVKNFGGFDVFVSNAGILHAGGLEEMSLEVFEKVTRVNYTAYFLCVKHVSPVLILQSKHHPSYFSDIIQINSKSGLRGSKKNFAYAGSKFGGIGLTQSFALELIPYRIKVNSICPGNFFEGPLWSDPETGLLVQYLRAGKVPGAKTIEDVKAHYESQVPAGRGCRVTDVMKAIYYVIEQEYETGQAIPVTGGQQMLK